MLIFGSDAERQQEHHPKALSETQSFGSSEWAIHQWKHCILRHYSHSAPGFQGKRHSILGKEKLWLPGLSSFLILSLVHPKSSHVRCQPRISRFIFYINYNLSLTLQRVLHNAVFLCFRVLYPCSNSLFFIFQNPSNCPNLYFRLSLPLRAVIRDGCIAHLFGDVPAWRAIRLPLPCQERVQLSRLFLPPPTLLGLLCKHWLKQQRDVMLASCLSRLASMAFTCDPLSVEPSHALGIATSWLKAVRHSRIFCDLYASPQKKMSNSIMARKEERTQFP